MILTIIIPIYNVEAYIIQCLESCITQNNVQLGIDYEIIAVDDGSPDRSGEMADTLLSKIKGCQVVHQVNKGLSEARNTGLNEAKGDYVWFVDSDDWIENESVSLILSKIENIHPDVIKIRAYNVYQDGKRVERQPQYFEDLNISGRDEGPKSFCNTPAQFNIMRRDWILTNRLSFMPGVYHEDNEFIPKMYWFAKNIGFINRPIYNYRQNPNSITHALNPKKSFDLIKVCNSLSSFIITNDIGKDKTFYNALAIFISISLNNAFHNIVIQNKDEQSRFEREFSRNSHLIKFLILSRKPKFMVEGILWKIFRHYTLIYKSLKRLT